MPKPIILNYQLTKDLWRQFFEAHYGCDGSLRMRYLWGAICIVIASLGFGGFYDSHILAGLLMATGFFGVLSRHLLIARSLRKAARHPFYGAELEVTIAPEEIAVQCGNSGYSQPWDNFVGYRRLKPGFLLYHDRHAFFFIPLSAMNDAHVRHITQILTAARVPDLAKSTGFAK